jgi:hypothetical protein
VESGSKVRAESTASAGKPRRGSRPPSTCGRSDPGRSPSRTPDQRRGVLGQNDSFSKDNKNMKMGYTPHPTPLCYVAFWASNIVLVQKKTWICLKIRVKNSLCIVFNNYVLNTVIILDLTYQRTQTKLTTHPHAFNRHPNCDFKQ